MYVYMYPPRPKFHPNFPLHKGETFLYLNQIYILKVIMRTAILDWTLCIGQLCALYDHLGEEEMNLLAEKEEVKPEEISVILSIDEDLAYLKQEQEAVLNQRRRLQGQLFHDWWLDHEQRCKFKHYATALASLQECSDADPNNKALHDELINFRKTTYRFLWRLVWGEPADCGRCLADVIDKTPNIEGEVGA